MSALIDGVTPRMAAAEKVLWNLIKHQWPLDADYEEIWECLVDIMGGTE
jgi:hypothetical protein